MSRQGKISFLLIGAAGILGGALLINEQSTNATPSRALASLEPTQATTLKASYLRPQRVPFPASNPFSEEKYQLGKRLFFDPRLSGSGKMACASCHSPQHNWTDGHARAIGNEGKVLGRKSPTILNAAWGTTFFWDGRADSLEAQALGPIQAEGEMNQKLPVLVALLKEVPEYKDRFGRAFPGQEISPETIAKAIATFERTITSDVSPFDRWIAGEEGAISEQAKRGFVLYNGKGTCVTCHNGWNFTNGSFADIGLLTNDEGRMRIEANPALAFAFKVPTLRNIAKRAPYMHDGSLPTLRDVVDNYASGGAVRRPTSKLFLKPVELNEAEKADLIAFLETLNSEDEAITAPALPKSTEKHP